MSADSHLKISTYSVASCRLPIQSFATTSRMSLCLSSSHSECGVCSSDLRTGREQWQCSGVRGGLQPSSGRERVLSNGYLQRQRCWQVLWTTCNETTLNVVRTSWHCIFAVPNANACSIMLLLGLKNCLCNHKRSFYHHSGFRF